jgi:hypothetical protein
MTGKALSFTFAGTPAEADALSRDLAAWITSTGPLRGTAGLRTAPPRPGEQGDLAMAVDIANASAALVAAITNAFYLWLEQRSAGRRIEFEATRPDGARISGSAGGPEAASALVEQLSRFASPPQNPM